MRGLIRRNFLIVLILILSGCVVNKPENTVPDDKETITSPFTDGSTYRTKSELLEVNNVDGLVELIYKVEYSFLAPVQRIFVLVDGFPSEFSLNGSDMGLYQDIQGEDFSAETLRIRPSIKGKKKGDTITIVPFLVLMDDSLKFDGYSYSLYLTDPFGVQATTTLDEYHESAIKHKEIEFSKIVDTWDHEFETLAQVLEETRKSPILAIQTKDSFRNTVKADGYIYDSSQDYYLTKLGVNDILVYPILNGEYMYEDGVPLSYHFPELEDLDMMSYTPFELQNYGIKDGDIISLLIWDIGSPASMTGRPKITIEK